MSMDKLIEIVYGYARAACRYTPLDYRDVAHTVIVNQLTRYRNGRIRHVRTYMYIAIRCAIATAMKRKGILNLELSMVDYPACDARDIECDIEAICSMMTPRECFMLGKIRRGYTRREIAVELGISVAGVNVMWHRMIRRLRKLQEVRDGRGGRNGA